MALRIQSKLRSAFRCTYSVAAGCAMALMAVALQYSPQQSAAVYAAAAAVATWPLIKNLHWFVVVLLFFIWSPGPITTCRYSSNQVDIFIILWTLAAAARTVLQGSRIRPLSELLEVFYVVRIVDLLVWLVPVESTAAAVAGAVVRCVRTWCGVQWPFAYSSTKLHSNTTIRLHTLLLLLLIGYRLVDVDSVKTRNLPSLSPRPLSLSNVAVLHHNRLCTCTNSRTSLSNLNIIKYWLRLTSKQEH